MILKNQPIYNGFQAYTFLDYGLKRADYIETFMNPVTTRNSFSNVKGRWNRETLIEDQTFMSGCNGMKTVDCEILEKRFK